MTLVDVFIALGEEKFQDLLKRVSISRLRTYQMFDQIKARTRLVKLNSEHLRRAAPRLWERLRAADADLASDLSQAILVSHLDMMIEALDLVGIPHQDGFFAKDAKTAEHLKEGWQTQTFDALKDKHPPTVLTFYLNHLGVETGQATQPFLPVP